VLGVLAALGGAVVGVLGAWAVIRWSGDLSTDTMFGRSTCRFRWSRSSSGAVASAVIAAMISRGWALDIVAACVARACRHRPRAHAHCGHCARRTGAGVFWAVAFTSAPSGRIDDVVPLVAMERSCSSLAPPAGADGARARRTRCPVRARGHPMALRDAARSGTGYLDGGGDLGGTVCCRRSPWLPATRPIERRPRAPAPMGSGPAQPHDREGTAA
jgi:hypothetical protein